MRASATKTRRNVARGLVAAASGGGVRLRSRSTGLREGCDRWTETAPERRLCTSTSRCFSPSTFPTFVYSLFLRFVAQRPLTVPTPFSGVNQKLPFSMYTPGHKSLYYTVNLCGSYETKPIYTLHRMFYITVIASITLEAVILAKIDLERVANLR